LTLVTVFVPPAFSCLSGFTVTREITLWLKPQADVEGSNPDRTPGEVMDLASIIAALTTALSGAALGLKAFLVL
jgi:hypothetical protein